MLDYPLILLQRSNDDDGPMRFLGILVVIAIFVLGNVMQWIKKYQEQQRKLALQRQAQMPTASQSPRQATAAKPSARQATQPRRNAPIQRAIPGLRKMPIQRPVQRKPLPTPPALPPGAPAPARRAAAHPPVPRPAPHPAAAEPQSHVTLHRRAAGQDITASEIGSHAKAQTSRAHALHDLLGARSLQRTYILTEILQPPVGLREEHL